MSSKKTSIFLDWDKKERFVHECLRYRALLYQIAERILHEPKGAEQAVNRCLTLATRVPDKNQPAGEFRSWLLRILIDEALIIRRKRMGQEESFANGVFRCGNYSARSVSLASR